MAKASSKSKRPRSRKDPATTSNGRNAQGRFTKGNPGGPGNPHSQRVGQLRSALLAAMTDTQWKRIIKSLLARAEAGEPWAVKEVLDRIIGKPIEADVFERLEAMEKRLAQAKEQHNAKLQR